MGVEIVNITTSVECLDIDRTLDTLNVAMSLAALDIYYITASDFPVTDVSMDGGEFGEAYDNLVDGGIFDTDYDTDISGGSL